MIFTLAHWLLRRFERSRESHIVVARYDDALSREFAKIVFALEGLP